MKKASNPGSRGLTLIELTLAVALSGILLTAVYTMLHASAVHWRRIETRSGLYQTGRSILSRMERDLDCALSLKSMAFLGDQNSISFIASSDRSPGFPALSRVEYRAVENADGAGLIRTERSLTADEDLDLSPSDRRRQWKSIKNFGLSYAYRNPSGAHWQSAWNRPDKIPQGVRVRLELESQGAKENVTLDKTIHVLSGELGRGD